MGLLVATYRPDLVVQCAFNADPGDQAAVPTWSDLSTLFRAASGVQRGRQYELDLNQAASPTMTFWDPNETLNPANTGSPYSPNVVPLRQILMQAVWPNPAAGNHLNLNAQGVAYDPGFESYTAGTAVSWIGAVGGTSPVVGTTTPHSGTKDVTWTVAGGATVQGASWVVPCIPGRQYTASLYVQQSSASTQQISIVGGTTGTSTTTTGAWVRLTVTFTATQPTHTVQVATTGTTVAGTVLLDDVQHEQAASASAFTTSGSVIYGVFKGYVERWPHTWDYAGYAGRADVTCVDAFVALAAVKLSTEYINAVMSKKPLYYWRLSEPNGATTFAESSGNNGPVLQKTVGKYGPADTFASGVATNIAGDPSGTGLQTQTAATGFAGLPATVAQTGLNNTTLVTVASATQPWAASCAFWMAHTPSVAGDAGRVYMEVISHTGVWLAASVYPDITHLYFGNSYTTLSIADNYADGKPHLYVQTWTMTGSVSTLNVYVDGVLRGTASGAATITITPDPSAAMIGGWISPDTGLTNPGIRGGVYTHWAIWNRALSAAEVTDLWNAGQGYVGENSGTRVTRYLGYGWTGTSSVDTGASAMGVSTLAASTAMLTACQGVATSENGNFWVDSRGSADFTSRTRRYLTTTATYVFGENSAGGELPYEGDIVFEEDPTYVYNDVTINNGDGFSAHVWDSTSQKRYFQRSYQRDVNVQSDYEAVDAGNWLLTQYKSPRQRVQKITLKPAGNPTLWQVVLGIEVGTRVTVRRRAKAANGGAGITMSADYFVEQITHDGINMATGEWETTLLLSPAATVVPLILDNGTYGLLDSGILGY